MVFNSDGELKRMFVHTEDLCEKEKRTVQFSQRDKKLRTQDQRKWELWKRAVESKKLISAKKERDQFNCNYSKKKRGKF